MSAENIVSLSVSVIGFLGVFIKLYFDSKKMNDMIIYRLDILEKKVDEHNGYAKRFGSIEKAIVRIDTKLEDYHGKSKK